MPNNQKFNLVCGMEVHAELKTESKMFCGCVNDPFGADQPNSHTCPVCLGMPGGIPVPNKKAIEWTIKLGLALGCEINLFSKFDRKHYFYHDLPKGYQISQYDIPFCEHGQVHTSFGPVGITRIHLEEDTGKLQHKKIDGKDVSLIDFNRGGVPLIEIVTEPDITSADQAKEFGKNLRQIIRYLDIADCDMEQGGMRLEANISLQKPGAKNLPNYKVEVKNINSFNFVKQAIEFEIDRQGKLLTAGQTPTQETRGWNAATSQTVSQRTKEDAEDYRYFPDPDIPPIRLTEKDLLRLKKELPELHFDKVKRWKKEFGIEEKYSLLLVAERPVAEYLESAFVQLQQEKADPNQLANLLTNKKLSFNPTQPVAELVAAFLTETKIESIDESELDAIIAQVIADNPAEVASYQAGKTQLINFFVGQVMRQLKKKIDVSQVKASLENALQS